MTDLIDSATAVRSGEELDIDRLSEYLGETLPHLQGPIRVTQFRQGYSNLTYLVRIGEHELVLRRPPFGNPVKTAHDMEREYRVLSKLWRAYDPAPRPFAYCEDADVLGETFYLMERRRGIVLRKKLPPGLELAPEMLRALCEAFVDNFANLHAVNYEAIGLGALGKPEGYVERQVNGWIKRYQKAATTEVTAMDELASWLQDNQPTEYGAALIHNDYKFDNMMVAPHDMTRIVAVLDWEMCTLGDPLMDLGGSLAVWVQADDDEMLKSFRVGPTDMPGAMGRRELIERYEEITGCDTSKMLFYYCFGMYKFAAIVQQIYVRFAKGLTSDARFAELDHVVDNYSRAAVQAIERGAVV